jgi:hypothetical protein
MTVARSGIDPRCTSRSDSELRDCTEDLAVRTPKTMAVPTARFSICTEDLAV